MVTTNHYVDKPLALFYSVYRKLLQIGERSEHEISESTKKRIISGD